MLRFSDFVTSRKRYYNQNGGLYISFETLYEDEIYNIPPSNTSKQNF